MTYLEVVNKVLVRLRENEVGSLTETSYSKLVAELVNVVKREIENSWNWHCLRETLTATTADGLFNYVLFGAGTTSRILNVYNDTEDIQMHPRSGEWFDQQMRMVDTVQKDAPMYYNINGVSQYGDMQMDFYPVPDGVYNIRINIAKQQDYLTEASERVLIDPHLLIEGVLARAVAERGEDGGMPDQEFRYRAMLSDLISIEAGHRPFETIWSAN
jgi:hypothetical protein